MPRPLGNIRILFSSRVLLDLEEADRIFKEKGVDAYRRYMIPRKSSPFYDPEIGGRRLNKGPLFDLAVALLKLNDAAGEPVVEVGLSCKDEVDTAVPIFRSLDVQGLDNVEYRIAKAGKTIAPEDHEAFNTDLFLTRNMDDVQNAVNDGIAAACIYIPPKGFDYHRRNKKAVRIFVDGDAVAFGSSSEVRYRKEGVTVYREMENHDFDRSIEAGPFTEVLAKISQLNAKFPRDEQPFEIALLTARGGDAAARALTIAQEHGIDFNGGTYFMGGAEKVDVLKAHRPDIYFDDQMVHLVNSAEFCPTGLVAYEEGSPMHKFQQEQEEAAKKAPKRKATRKLEGETRSPRPPSLNP